MMPKRLQVFEDSLYITLSDQTIYRIDKFGHTKGEVLVESFQRTSDLLIIHPLKQEATSMQTKQLFLLFYIEIDQIIVYRLQFQIHARRNHAMSAAFVCYRRPIRRGECANVSMAIRKCLSAQ